MDHLAHGKPGVAKQVRRAGHIALFQCHARCIGMHGLRRTPSIRHNAFDNLDREAITPAGIYKEARRSAACLAEVEVIAHDSCGNSEASHEDIAHEIFGAEAGEPGIEAHDDKPVEPQPGQTAHLLGNRGQPENRARTGEIVDRVRFEGECRGRLAEPGGKAFGMADDRRMPPVDPIEIADGDHGA